MKTDQLDLNFSPPPLSLSLSLLSCLSALLLAVAGLAGKCTARLDSQWQNRRERMAPVQPSDASAALGTGHAISLLCAFSIGQRFSDTSQTQREGRKPVSVTQPSTAWFFYCIFHPFVFWLAYITVI